MGEPAIASGACVEICRAEDRERWLVERHRGIGASEVAIVLGESPWSSPLHLYARKTGAIVDDSDNDALEAGRRLEPVIVDWFADRAGCKVLASGILYRSAAEPWALATLDAWAELDGEWCPLEVKTTNAFKADDWQEGTPRHYWWQCQAQAFVMGAPRVAVACLIGGQRFVWDVVERDEGAISHMVRTCRVFWQMVEAEMPPSPDDTRFSKAALDALYPSASEGKSIELPAELLDAADGLEEYKREIKNHEALARECENRIKAALGDAERGYFADGSGFSWKTISMPERTLKATTFRRLTRTKSKARK